MDLQRRGGLCVIFQGPEIEDLGAWAWRGEISERVLHLLSALLVETQFGMDPTKRERSLQVRFRQYRGASQVKCGLRVGLHTRSPADSSMPPGPLTHLSLPDSSEARLQIGADGRSLPGSWTR